jgi:hypothetical protein
LPPAGGRGYGGLVERDQILRPMLDPALEGTLRAQGLPALWTGATPIPGGRGTARLLTRAGCDLVLKRERRGGWAGKVLPDRYVWRRPFLREWALGCQLAVRGLAPEPVALEFTGHTAGFQVYALSRAILPSCSLAELWREGRMDGPVMAAAGRAVARLHREGILHGDLNAGNMLFASGQEALFLDLRHSRILSGGLPPRARQNNLLRLCRSLHKLQSLHGRPWPPASGDLLTKGYAEGWGSAETWLRHTVRVMDRGFPWRRRLFWSR